MLKQLAALSVQATRGNSDLAATVARFPCPSSLVGGDEGMISLNGSGNISPET